MPRLPERKVGLIACSGEDLPEGTVSRQAALLVLERLRPGATVTLCLPLFLAGEERERGEKKVRPQWKKSALVQERRRHDGVVQVVNDIVELSAVEAGQDLPHAGGAGERAVARIDEGGDQHPP